MKKYNVNVGDRFGILTVISTERKRTWKSKLNLLWMVCQCDCGNVVSFLPAKLGKGTKTHCGCLMIETSQTPNKSGSYKTYKDAWMPSAIGVWRSTYKDGCSFEKFLELSQQNCFYCDDPPSNKYNAYNRRDGSRTGERHDAAWFVYNGLDRIDPSKPHSEDNIVPCCHQCNWAKSDKTQAEFYDWLGRAYKKLEERRLAFSISTSRTGT